VGDILEFLQFLAALGPDGKKWKGKTDEASDFFACEENP
jgi:hypothetical protein